MSSQKLIPFLISNHLFHLPESSILSYPYSKLADLAATSLPDDVAKLNLPVDSFSILATYLSTRTLPPATLHPASLRDVFQTLGIPFPDAVGDGGGNQHEASLGRSSLRVWEKHNLGNRGREEYDEEVRVGLGRLEGGLFTSRRVDEEESGFGSYSAAGTVSSAAASGEGSSSTLPAYHELAHSSTSSSAAMAAAAGDEKSKEIAGVPGVITKVISAMNAMSRRKPRLVILIPADTHSLRAADRPIWASEADEKVSSYVPIPNEQKEIVRLHRPWTSEELEETVAEIWEGISGVFGENYLVRVAMEEVVIRQCNAMGLYESVSGDAVVVCVSP
ncbi:hypothetical protein L873DRAFT_1683305 [Choiromyces venosus 120613-1]|uniref:Uncharacterized protein n=1 Tax=Choiromyces venosus 120613-1 TaxID=1336337 RepID=A0A3N4JN05_9PEZI|nr:hypothetical protein L873DRAFT_1683305 [Choiromyces venosus 120613-1]